MDRFATGSLFVATRLAAVGRDCRHGHVSVYDERWRLVSLWYLPGDALIEFAVPRRLGLLSRDFSRAMPLGGARFHEAHALSPEALGLP
jgi:hypothetical protein